MADKINNHGELAEHVIETLQDAQYTVALNNFVVELLHDFLVDVNPDVTCGQLLNAIKEVM